MRKGDARRLSDERWFTISEVSRRIGFSRAKVYSLIASAVLPHTTIGGQKLIPQSGLDALLGAQFSPARADAETVRHG